MDKMVLRIFQREVANQCEYAIISAQLLDDCLRNLNKEGASSQLWYHAQNFLISAANVSKLLWGNEKTFESRKQLRDSVNVTNNSPLRSRSLRNHFEHFDERIEKWASSSKRNNFADSNIGPKNMITGLDPDDFLRNFDTDSLSLTFRGESYQIQPLVDELIVLYDISKQESDKPHW